MGSLVSGGIDPVTADFSDGLKVLLAYHDSFILQGRRLLELAQAISKQGMNEDRDATAIYLAEYYDRTMGLHHGDEERALFPSLVNKSFMLDGMIERLAFDHLEIEALWAEFNEILRAPHPLPDPAACLGLATRFEISLKAHVERENLDFFPLVAALLTPVELAEIGGRMASLRS